MLENNLKQWFGHESFHPGQKEVIESVLQGNHTLGVLPTGSGKVCVINFQLICNKTYSYYFTANFFNG